MRSSVIDIEFQITSIFLVVSAGMMPSQAVGVMTQSSLASAQTASRNSISQPTHLPEASTDANGG